MASRKFYGVFVSGLLLLFALSGCGKTQWSSRVQVQSGSVGVLRMDDVAFQPVTLESLSDASGDSLKIVYTPSGEIKEISGIQSDFTISTSEDALRAVSAFGSIFGISDVPSFALLRKDAESYNDLVLYELKQVYDGVPVEDGLFRVFVDRNTWTLTGIGGQYVNIKSANTKPEIPESDARTVLPQSAMYAMEQVSLVLRVIDSDSNEMGLFWKYETGITGMWTVYYVDAMTGELTDTVFGIFT